jgi:hypothetical protein
MRYLLMIFSEETPPDQVSPEEWGQVMEEYNEFGRRLRERGAMLGGEALQDSSTATTIRVRDGQTLTTDGPFIESKEVLGGFYLVECASVDEALDWAARELGEDRCTSQGGEWRIDPSGLPRELRRRLLSRAIREVRQAFAVEPAWTGSEDVENLLATLEVGGTGTLAGVMASGGAVWHLRLAPPRRKR